MTMIRFSPTGELRRLQREIDQLFDNFSPARGDQDSAETQTTWTPRVDLAETEDAYLILLDVPGMSKEDLNISFQNNVLTVSGERKTETTREGHKYVRVERASGHFYRSFTLPKAVKTEGIQANYQDGVLKIWVPKAEESKPRRVEIS